MARFVRSSLVALAACAALAGPVLAIGTSTYVYVHANGSSPSVYAFRLDPGGALTPVAGSPFFSSGTQGECFGFCNAAAFAADPRVLVTAGGTGVHTWTTDASGVLSEVSGSPAAFSASGGGTSLTTALVGSRTFVYTVQFESGALDGFEMAGDGTLSRISGMPLTGLAGIESCSAGGNKLAVLDENHHSMRTYVIGADGTLTPPAGKPVRIAGGGKLYFCTTTANGAFVLTGDWAKGRNVYAYRIDATTARLKRAGSMKLKIKDADGGISVASNGLVAAFASGGTKDMQILALNEKGKLLKRGKGQSSGLTHVTTHAWSPDGTLLVASSATNGETRSYAVSPAGVVTPTDVESTPSSDAMNGMAIVTR